MRRLLTGLIAGASLCALPAYALDVAALQAQARAGSVAAERDLGLAYRRGEVGSVNAEAAATWLRKAAEAGDAEAQFQLGLMYLNEYGIPADKVQAMTWLNKAAQSGNGKAQADLYSLYRAKAGEPGAEDKATQIWPLVGKNLVRAAEDGDPEAQLMICPMVETRGNDIGPDGQKPVFESPDACRAWSDKARATYLKRAQEGDAEAVAIAGANIEIWNTDRSVSVEGRAMVKQAAEAGVVRAMNATAQSDLSNGPDANPVEALAYLHRAADAHSLSALNRLAAIYFQGDGVPKDLAQSQVWLRKAGEAGSDKAQLMLGMLYSDHGNEHLVPVDMDQALKWYGLSARQGNVAAQLHLCILYYEGRQVPQDKALAYAWWLITSDFVAARNVEATLTLASLRSDFARVQNLENDLTPDEKMRAEAVARDLRGQLN